MTNHQLAPINSSPTIISGDGELVTGMMVFPGKILRKDWVEKNPGGFA
jgi:hypothetical protein